MSPYVALLRGINVGGKNKLPMSSLVAAFTETGCTNVRTYIQSGNVVFSAAPNSLQRRPGPTHESTDELSKHLLDRVATQIADRFGLQVPDVLRTVSKPRYTGYTCWRGVAHLEVKSPPSGLSFETWGPGARFSVHHCGPGGLIWYATRNV